MRLRRTAFGLTAVLMSLVGLAACGGGDKTAPPVGDTPTSSTPTASASSPKPVDPTATAKIKALADYQYYVAFWSKGKVSGNPAYPYEQVMAGKALSMTKSVATADQMRGIKASGSVKFLRGSVVALSLTAKPATARIQSCELDQITGVDKKGRQVYRPVGEVSSATSLVLEDGRWKVTGKAVSGKEEGACAR